MPDGCDNQGQETTGSNGCLPERMPDLCCPAMQNNEYPDYRPNYYKSSCEIRLAAKTCKNHTCEHFTGAIPTPAQYGAAAVTLEDKRDRNVNCACGCGRFGRNQGRGLVRGCHARVSRQGKLESYPSLRVNNG